MRKQIIRILTAVLALCLGLAVFAACRSEEDTYTVKYAAGGGTGSVPAEETYAEGDTFTVKSNPFTYDGHTFKTWNDGTKDVAAGSTYTMPANDVTFTAVWEEVKPAEKVTVTYDLGEYKGGKAPDAATVDKGSEVTLPDAPAWEGHLFRGWKVGDDATLKQAGDKITPQANVTAVAQWVEKVTVTYDLGEYEGGKAPDEAEVAKGSEVTLPAAPAWEGHLFRGWKVGEEVKQTNEKVTVDADITITAQWAAVEFKIEGITIEAREDGVDLIINGTYEGYTAYEFKYIIENTQEPEDKSAIWFSFYAVKGGPEDDSVPRTATVANGEWKLTIAVETMNIGGYTICWKNDGYGDIDLTLDQAPNNTVEYEGKTYSVVNKDGNYWNHVALVVAAVVPEPTGTFTTTALTLEKQGEAVYVVYKGTYEDFEADTLEVQLKAKLPLVINKIGGGSTTSNDWAFTATEGKWEAKLNITIGSNELFVADGIYFIDTVNNYSAHADLNLEKGALYNMWMAETNVAISLGDYVYTPGDLIGSAQSDPVYTWGNVTFTITAKETTEEKTLTPTEVTLEPDDEVNPTKIYVVIKANVTGYTAEDLKTVVFIGEKDDMRITVDENIAIAEGVATLKFDFTGASTAHWWWGHYTIGEGAQTDLKVTVTEVTKYVGKQSYRLFNQDGMTIIECKAISGLTFTNAKLVEEDNKVYLLLTAINAEGYTQEQLNSMVYIGEYADSQTLSSPTVTLEGNVVTIKFDFTDAVDGWWWGHYTIESGNSIDLHSPIEEKTVTKGNKSYQLRYNDGDSSQQIIVVVSTVED